jgi:hypothetical protein
MSVLFLISPYTEPPWTAHFHSYRESVYDSVLWFVSSLKRKIDATALWSRSVASTSCMPCFKYYLDHNVYYLVINLCLVCRELGGVRDNQLYLCCWEGANFQRDVTALILI